MPGTARRGRRSATLKKKDAETESSETEQAGTEEVIETDSSDITLPEVKSETTNQTSTDDCSESTTDKLAVLGENDAEARDEGQEVEEISVDLQIKDETDIGTAMQETKEDAVEVMIEGLPEPTVKSPETMELEKQDVPVTETDNRINTSKEEKPTAKEDAVETAIKTTEPAGFVDFEDDKADVSKVTIADSGSKDEVKADLVTSTGEMSGPSADTLTDTTQPEETSDTPAETLTTPVKEPDQTTTDLEQSSPISGSPNLTDTDTLDQESSGRLQFPASLAKLRNLTVNIGPIRQMDLKSEKLHEILTLSDNFEIKFELKDKKDAHGRFIQEKSGFVRLPFEITTPTFLIRVAHRLGSLHIDGRDMSVKFPEAFNKALDECKLYIDKVKHLRDEKFEMKKRQISVKNVPANVSEETIRSLFPEAQKITLNYEELPDGGSKVGSVLLDFDTEEACIQCLDMNKDVFIEDCQLKIFRLYSERRYRAARPSLYARGRGFGRGRVMAQRGGFKAAQIRKRVLGFGSGARGKGMAGTVTRGSLSKKPIGSLSRKLSASPATPNVNAKSPGATGQQKPSPRGPVTPGRGQRRWSSGGSRAGSYQSPVSHEGQFKGFVTPNRETNRGRRRTRPYRGGRGNSGYQQRSEERSPSFRGEQPRQSPHRSERSQYRSYRNEQRYSQSSNREEDPRAMMEYLKSTIARMEEKMTTRDYGDRGYDRHEEQSRSTSYSSRGRGRGRGRGDQNRKRPSDNRDYGQSPKRQFMGGQDRRDSRSDYYSPQQNMNTGARRDSVGRAVGDMLSDYRQDRDLGSHGGSHVSSHRDGHGNSHGGNQGYRSGSYGDSGNRNRRDSYGGRAENFNKGYSGGQFGMRGRGGSGRGQSRGRGYNKGSNRGQLW